MHRTLTRSPSAKLEEHGWTLEAVPDLEHPEMFLPISRVCLVSAAVYDQDPDGTTAHVAAHLDSGHPIGGAFTDAQEDEADAVADRWLGREVTVRPPRRAAGRIVVLSAVLGLLAVLIPDAPPLDGRGRIAQAWADTTTAQSAAGCSLNCPGDSATVTIRQPTLQVSMTASSKRERSSTAPSRDINPQPGAEVVSDPSGATAAPDPARAAGHAGTTTAASETAGPREGGRQ